jgi:hypothetical protein
VVESTGLENRQTRKSLVSSNLTLSASKNRQMLAGRSLEAVDPWVRRNRSSCKPSKNSPKPQSRNPMVR